MSKALCVTERVMPPTRTRRTTLSPMNPAEARFRNSHNAIGHVLILHRHEKIMPQLRPPRKRNAFLPGSRLVD